MEQAHFDDSEFWICNSEGRKKIAFEFEWLKQIEIDFGSANKIYVCFDETTNPPLIDKLEPISCNFIASRTPRCHTKVSIGRLRSWPFHWHTTLKQTLRLLVACALNMWWMCESCKWDASKRNWSFFNAIRTIGNLLHTKYSACTQNEMKTKKSTENWRHGGVSKQIWKLRSNALAYEYFIVIVIIINDSTWYYVQHITHTAHMQKWQVLAEATVAIAFIWQSNKNSH